MVLLIIPNTTYVPEDIGEALGFVYYKYTHCWVRHYESVDETRGMGKVLCGLGIHWFVEDHDGSVIYSVEECEEDMLLSVATAEAVNT